MASIAALSESITMFQVATKTEWAALNLQRKLWGFKPKQSDYRHVCKTIQLKETLFWPTHIYLPKIFNAGAKKIIITLFTVQAFISSFFFYNSMGF